MWRAHRRILVILFGLMLGACAREEPAPDPILAKGETIYKGTCKACHAQAINGAPIPGNKKMWGKRAEQGIETLVQHAAEGYGLMPAKGGNESLTSEDLKAAITFMLSKLDAKPES